MALARIRVLTTNKLGSPPLHCALPGARGFYDRLDEILELVDLFMDFFFFRIGQGFGGKIWQSFVRRGIV